MKRLAVAVWLACAAGTASAADLIDAWHAAQQHDPMLAASGARRDGAAAQRDQARAVWRPNVVAAGSAGRANADSSIDGAQFSAPAFGTSRNVDFQTSIRDGTATSWNLTLTQPLYSGERIAQSRELAAGADAGDAAARRMEQEAMLRTATRYFDVLVARKSLALSQQQYELAQRNRQEAQDRFRIGDAPVIDSDEAEARAAAIAADLTLARTRLDLAEAALRDQTGLQPGPMKVPSPRVDVPLAGSLEDWLSRAHGNPALAEREAALAAARAESARYRAAASPTLDVVAQAGGERISGSGDFGSGRDSANRQFLGLQLTVPLYTGGMRSAKQMQAASQVVESRAELEAAQLDVAQQVRAAWQGMTASSVRLKSLEAAERASTVRLVATKLGRKVGDRTMLDLLNAENDASAAQLALFKGRIERIALALQLAAATGELNEAVLASANAELQEASEGTGETAHGAFQ